MIDDGVWKAWYQSITKWTMIDNLAEPFYHIKYAESNDGIHWNRNAKVAIDYKDLNEAGICSASVIFETNLYKMWYCYRQNGNYRFNKDYSYRIGYAESENGIDWIRKDEHVGIAISNEGWDSEMIAYPNVVKFQKSKFMFFNGNGFGLSGFGYAVLN
jgi:hypothetical protein